MPPSTPENSNSNLNESYRPVETYHDVERTDAQHRNTGNFQNTTQQNTSQTSTTTSSTSQKNIDPIEIIKKMISAGFTPTKAQIVNANSNASGASDSSNTWFALFLQRLIRQEKNRKNK